MDHPVKVHHNHQINMDLHHHHQANMVHQAKVVDPVDLEAVQAALDHNNHPVNMVHLVKVEIVEALAVDHHNHSVDLIQVVLAHHIFHHHQVK